jgi:hypothetical protein
MSSPHMIGQEHLKITIIINSILIFSVILHVIFLKLIKKHKINWKKISLDLYLVFRAS